MSLVAKLKIVAEHIKDGPDVHSDYFQSADDFAQNVDQLIYLIERSENGLMANLKATIARKKAKYTWCAPTFDLDDYLVGLEGSTELANEIHHLL